MNNDLKNCKKLQEKLKEGIEATASAEKAWEKVEISLGTAICKNVQSTTLSEQLVIAENDMLKGRDNIE